MQDLTLLATNSWLKTLKETDVEVILDANERNEFGIVKKIKRLKPVTFWFNTNRRHGLLMAHHRLSNLVIGLHLGNKVPRKMIAVRLLKQQRPIKFRTGQYLN